MAHLPVGECTSFRRHPVDLLAQCPTIKQHSSIYLEKRLINHAATDAIVLTAAALSESNNNNNNNPICKAPECQKTSVALQASLCRVCTATDL